MAHPTTIIEMVKLYAPHAEIFLGHQFNRYAVMDVCVRDVPTIVKSLRDSHRE